MGLTELDQNDFTIQKGQIKYNKPIFKQMGGIIVFKADWCGHCKRLLPELQQLSNSTGLLYPITLIDADKNSDLVSKAGIQGFPTIKFVNNKGILKSAYEGARTASDILEAICDSKGSKGSFCTF